MRGFRILTSLFVILAALNLYGQQSSGGNCMVCHKKESPGLYLQWQQSKHSGHNVTCIDCHKADSGDPDAYEHEGATIATLVTPKDCGRCHQKETKEVSESYHATAGKILQSKDAYQAHVGGGYPVAITGCTSCHGAKVEIDDDSPNKLSKVSWPNSGIGRINPDGSLGACTACSKCHLGPDHPQKEIYEESKHGNTFMTNRPDMNLKSDKWVVGEDYFLAPTCATCHMGATPSTASTHDVGMRLKWTLRPPVSKKKDNWEVKRANMKGVCINCHGDRFAEGHFYQMDAVINLYDEKFGKPAAEIMKLVEKNNLREHNAEFANEIDWIYWELWHHEGRRARHGVAMMGPDYTWWHGIYDVIHKFYIELIPAAREFENEEVNAYIDQLLDEPMHQWLNENTADLKKKIRSGELQEIYMKFFPDEN